MPARPATVPARALLAALALALAPSAADAQRRPPRRPPATNPRRRPPPPPEPPPPPPPPPVVDPEPARRPTGARDPFSEDGSQPPREAPPEEPSPAHHPRVDLEAQYRLFTRSLAWDDDAMRAFRPYDLDAASAFRLAAEVHPLGFVTDGVASHLALTAAFGAAFLLDSQDSRGRRFDTTAYDLALGLRFRIPLAPSLPDLGVSAGWSRQVFYVRASDTQGLAGVPDLVYDGLRAGLSARFAVVWRLSLRVDAGFTYVLSTGELGESFLPRASALGFDGAAALALRLWEGLEVRAGVDVRTYLVSANREPSDRYAVTGMTDRYLAGTLGVAWRR